MSNTSYEELRRSGHRIVDLIVDYWGQVENRRVVPDVDRETIFQRFANTLSDQGVGLDCGIAELESIMGASVGMSHPLYLGLVNSTPLPAAVLGDLLVSALDNNGGASHQGPAHAAAEQEVVQQLASLLDYSGEGMILPGGTYC